MVRAFCIISSTLIALHLHTDEPGKSVTQLSLPVYRTAPQPNNIQHTLTDSQRHTKVPLTHISQRPRPLNTTGEGVTKRDNITRGNRKFTLNPKELTVSKRTKRTAHTSLTTTSPETCTPTQNTHLITVFTRESQQPSQLDPHQCPPTPLSPITPQSPKKPHHQNQHHTDTPNTQDFTPNDLQHNTRPPPSQTLTITHLVEALTTHDQHIKILIQSLPEDWANYIDRGSLVTKRQLLQSAWG